MVKPITIESHLQCRATVELHKELALDLSMPDKPIKDLLLEPEEKDESKNNNESSN
jgi:hypothetical protein